MTVMLSLLPPPTVEAVEKVLSKFQGVERVSVDSWRAHCPAVHNDHAGDRALSIWVNKPRTRIHLACNAGCSEADVRLVAEIPVSELFVLDPDLSARAAEAGGVDEATGERRLPKAVCALHAPPPEPITWTVSELLVAGEMALLVGDGGSFKSTAGLALVGAVAGGYPVWGQFPASPRPALVVSVEDAASVVQMRLESLVAGHGWDRRAVLGNVHYIASPDVALANAQWQAHLMSEAIRIDAGVVMLDPLADLLEGDENSNSDVRPLIKFSRALARATEAAVLIVHHAGKMGDGKRSIDRIRGASALNAAARSILFFDYHDTGVTVEHLKMSRTPRQQTFVLSRSITSDPQNRAQWLSANLTYQDARSVALSRAETFVLTQVGQSSGLTTSDLKKAATGVPGLSGEGVSEAIKVLQSRGRITFLAGDHGAKRWRLLGPLSQVANLAETLPGKQHGQGGVRGGQVPHTNYRAEPLRGSATRGTEEEQQRSRPGEKGPNGVPPVLHREVEEEPGPFDDDWQRWDR